MLHTICKGKSLHWTRLTAYKTVASEGIGTYTRLQIPASPGSQPSKQPLPSTHTHTAYHKMSELKAGDKFPEGVSFGFIRPTPEKAEITACGMPEQFNASKEFADKKAVLVAVPGAFTPTCQADHVTGYIAKLDQLRKAGVDQVVFIAYNDPFVMSAWGKANNIKDESIVGVPPFRCSTLFLALDSVFLCLAPCGARTALYLRAARLCSRW